MSSENSACAEMVERTRRAYIQAYGKTPELIVTAPGRVNLIGEHTDYNDGFVLPAAIDRQVVMAAGRRDDGQVGLRALDFDDAVEFHVANQRRSTVSKWSNYQRAVIWALQEAGYEVPGFNAVFTSDVPIGSGLSSSAAIELATCQTLQKLADIDLDGVTRALLCQKAENEFVGMRCGIMDQYIISLGQAQHALLIDCRDLSYQAVPLPQGVKVVICDTKKRRGLVDSAYNTRRAECEAGAAAMGVKALRDISPEQFTEYELKLDTTVRKRCRHVITENQRVLDAVAAMRVGDLTTLGRLLNESHASLRDDYEVSCTELDIMTEIAWRQPGVLGARMTGAGFGGCTVNLVEDEHAEAFLSQVSSAYQLATGLQPDIYICTAVEGAHQVV